ncbi:MAG: purine-nucleoside phosphorylase [Solirubrobacteraceae bacterium]
MSETLHLHPTAPLAGRVLLPGDPGRALLLAQSLLAEPRMFNHNRGLWGYTGVAADGEQLTIQSTGMGGPSAAIVISELAQLGARTMLRVGTCGALVQSLSLGELLIADAALVADGASAALGAPERVEGSPELVRALQTAAGSDAHTATVVSTDLFYDPGRREQGWRLAGASAVEMETAVLFTLAGVHGIRSGSVLIVSDLILPERRRIAADALTAAEHSLGELAASALSALPVL